MIAELLGYSLVVIVAMAVLSWQQWQWFSSKQKAIVLDKVIDVVVYVIHFLQEKVYVYLVKEFMRYYRESDWS